MADIFDMLLCFGCSTASRPYGSSLSASSSLTWVSCSHLEHRVFRVVGFVEAAELHSVFFLDAGLVDSVGAEAFFLHLFFLGELHLLDRDDD